MGLNRRDFVQGRTASMAWEFGPKQPRAEVHQQRPNIVFLLADDQSCRWLRCMGNRL